MITYYSYTLKNVMNVSRAKSNATYSIYSAGLRYKKKRLQGTDTLPGSMASRPPKTLRCDKFYA